MRDAVVRRAVRPWKIPPLLLLLSGCLMANPLSAQILMSGGTYSQNFDALASTNAFWTNNVTLPGWYAAKAGADITNTLAGAGTGTTGGLYSFATNGTHSVTDRALGSVAGSGNTYVYGIRFTNDTGLTITNVAVSYTGEQWRNASTIVNTLAFTYGTGDSPITNSYAAAIWTSFPALNFDSPVFVAATSGLDGNNATNRIVFTNVVLTGVLVPPGSELFLRWADVDDTGSDHGMAIDDLTVTFQTTSNAPPPATNFPAITAQPQSQATGSNGFAIFSVEATGTPVPNYQWQFNATNLPGATNATLALYNVTANQAGNYSVLVTNSFGGTNSSSAALIVTPVSFDVGPGALRYLTYNVNGNGATNDWSTNATQVQAIGRQLVYLNPDVVTFNEIVYTNTFQMANWVKAYLPGFFLATNSATDGSIRSVIASRFPIIRQQSWLGNSSLAPYGYTGTGFTRDLYEAQLSVSNWPLPLHVFIVHLKATISTPQDDADKRAAQASAISNFFVNTYFTGTNATHPYILSGDMNEDAFFPETSRYTSGQPIQRLTSPAVGLQMTMPVNPFSNPPSNAYTESIRKPLDTRFDYILPCAQLFTNIAASEIFRTDLLNPVPLNLNSNDDKIASDHLPVLMVFNNPFNTPFQLVAAARTNQSVTLKWESQYNRTFNIEASSNLVSWTPFAVNIATATTNSPFVFTTNNVADALKFFRIYRVP